MFVHETGKKMYDKCMYSIRIPKELSSKNDIENKFKTVINQILVKTIIML